MLGRSQFSSVVSACISSASRPSAGPSRTQILSRHCSAHHFVTPSTNSLALIQAQNDLRHNLLPSSSSLTTRASSTLASPTTPSSVLSSQHAPKKSARYIVQHDFQQWQKSISLSTKSDNAKIKQNAQPANSNDCNGFKQIDSVSFDRQIRIKRRITSHDEDISISNLGNNLDGYKYRVLKTPQLTNGTVTLPQTPAESTPSSMLESTASQMTEKEIHDIQKLQQQYAEDLAREKAGGGLHLPRGSTAAQTSQNAVQSSIRNRRSSHLLEQMMSKDSYVGFLPDERQNLEEENDDDDTLERIRVRSVQAASSIDVVAVLSKVFGGGVARASQYDVNSQQSKENQHPLSDFFASSEPIRHVFGRSSIIIQLSPPPADCPSSLCPSVPRYVAIYRFGSVVFFNLTTKEASRLLEQIKKHAVDSIAIGFERREHFEVALQPELETATGKIAADRANIRVLDMNTVGIVSDIMGQTVALDWHNDTVDELLANFSRVNSSVERTGSFSSMERHTLFQVVARNNSLFIDMVGKMGIKDRSDTAWHLSQYEGLHEGMRKEFDLDKRFKVSHKDLNVCHAK